MADHLHMEQYQGTQCHHANYVSIRVTGNKTAGTSLATFPNGTLKTAERAFTLGYTRYLLRLGLCICLHQVLASATPSTACGYATMD